MTREKDVSELATVTDLEVGFSTEGRGHFLHLLELQTPHHRHGSRRHLGYSEAVVVHMVVIARVNC